MYQLSESNIEVVAEQRVWTAVIARTVEEWISGPLRSQREAESYLFTDEKISPMFAARQDSTHLRCAANSTS